MAERGFSVAYESASAALGAFEAQRFSRDTAEGESAASRVREYLGCDLMILDDLGTEMVTSFSVSALYQLVNTRLGAGQRQTIISTNAGFGELARQIRAGRSCPGLTGEYLKLLPYFRAATSACSRKERVDMRQHEITRARAPAGQRREHSRAGLRQAAPARLPPRGHQGPGLQRIKEWDYYLVNNGRYALALTVADNGYMGMDTIILPGL